MLSFVVDFFPLGNIKGQIIKLFYLENDRSLHFKFQVSDTSILWLMEISDEISSMGLIFQILFLFAVSSLSCPKKWIKSLQTSKYL